MKQPQQLKHTQVFRGVDVSSIFVPIGTEGGYFETMLFLSEKTIDGLENFETFNKFDGWEQNHEALVSKVRSIMAFGPVR